MELFIMLLTQFPIVELFAHGVNIEGLLNNEPGAVVGFGYDIFQFGLALQGVLKGVQQFSKLLTKLSDETPWTFDDNWGKGLFGIVTTALDIVSAGLEWMVEKGLNGTPRPEGKVGVHLRQ